MVAVKRMFSSFTSDGLLVQTLVGVVGEDNNVPLHGECSTAVLLREGPHREPLGRHIPSLVAWFRRFLHEDRAPDNGKKFTASEKTSVHNADYRLRARVWSL